jgi:hypothetical protein
MEPYFHVLTAPDLVGRSRLFLYDTVRETPRRQAQWLHCRFVAGTPRVVITVWATTIMGIGWGALIIGMMYFVNLTREYDERLQQVCEREAHHAREELERQYECGGW